MNETKMGDVIKFIHPTSGIELVCLVLYDDINTQIHSPKLAVLFPAPERGDWYSIRTYMLWEEIPVTKLNLGANYESK